MFAALSAAGMKVTVQGTLDASTNTILVQFISINEQVGTPGRACCQPLTST
jgi:hypothetical protein